MGPEWGLLLWCLGFFIVSKLSQSRSQKSWERQHPGMTARQTSSPAFSLSSPPNSVAYFLGGLTAQTKTQFGNFTSADFGCCWLYHFSLGISSFIVRLESKWWSQKRFGSAILFIPFWAVPFLYIKLLVGFPVLHTSFRPPCPCSEAAHARNRIYGCHSSGFINKYGRIPLLQTASDRMHFCDVLLLSSPVSREYLRKGGSYVWRSSGWMR